MPDKIQKQSIAEFDLAPACYQCLISTNNTKTGLGVLASHFKCKQASTSVKPLSPIVVKATVLPLMTSHSPLKKAHTKIDKCKNTTTVEPQ